MLAESNPTFGKLFAHILEHLSTAAPDRNDLVSYLAFAAPLASRSQSQLFQKLRYLRD